MSAADIRDAMDKAIQDVCATNPLDQETPSIVSKWVLAVEWLDAEGMRWLSSMRSKDTYSWDAKGMLHTVIDDLVASDVAEALEVED